METRAEKTVVVDSTPHQGKEGEMEYRGSERIDVLLPKKMFRFLTRNLRFGEMFVGNPYRAEGGRYFVVPKPRFYIWCCHMILASFFGIFVLVRCIQIHVDKSRSKLERIYMQLMTTYWLLSVMFHTALMKHLKALPLCVNHILEMTRKLEEKYVIAGARVPLVQKAVVLVMDAMYHVLNVSMVMLTLNAFLRPKSPEFFSSLVDDQNLSIGVRILAAGAIFYVAYLFTATSYAFISAGFPLFALVATMIKELSPKMAEVTTDALRESDSKFHMYQQLRIQTKLINEVMNEMVLPFYKYAGIVLIVLCAYGGIRFRGSEAFALAYMALYTTSILIVIFSFLAEFHFNSTKLLVEWKGEIFLGESSLLREDRRRVMSLPPVKAIMRGQYFVDKRMVLHMVMIISVHTIDFLLANP